MSHKNNSLKEPPVTLERVGYVLKRLERITTALEAQGGIAGDRNAVSWLKHTVTLIKKVQKENTTIKQSIGCQLAKHKTRKLVMIAYRNKIADLQRQLGATREGMGRNRYKTAGRGPDKALRQVGSIIKAAEPKIMAQQIAEAIDETSYVYKTKTGACIIRRQETPSDNAELVGVYDAGCDWREICMDLVA